MNDSNEDIHVGTTTSTTILHENNNNNASNNASDTNTPMNAPHHHHHHHHDDHHHGHHVGGTVTAAILGIVKAMVGPAILYLPSSFAHAGYAFCLPALAASLALYLYASQRLLQAWAYVVETLEQQQQEHSQVPPPTSSPDKDTIEMVSLKQYGDDDHDHDNNNKNNNNNRMNSNGGTLMMMTTSTSPYKKYSTDEEDDDGDEDNDLYSSSPTEPDGLHRRQPTTPPTLTLASLRRAQSMAANDTTTTTTTMLTNHTITYPQLAYLAYGARGKLAVRTGICLMQLGICLTYFIFVPHNLTVSVAQMTAGRIVVPLWAGLLVMVLVEIPLCWMRDIRTLVHTNTAANIMITFGLLSCLYLALFYSTNTASAAATTTTTVDVNGNAVVDTTTFESSTVTHLAPWNDQWYLFIGTSVRYTHIRSSKRSRPILFFLGKREQISLTTLLLLSLLLFSCVFDFRYCYLKDPLHYVCHYNKRWMSPTKPKHFRRCTNVRLRPLSFFMLFLE